MILEQIQMRKSNTHCQFWINVNTQVVLAKTIGWVIENIVDGIPMIFLDFDDDGCGSLLEESGTKPS